MRVFSYSLIVSVLLFWAIPGFAQDVPTGIAKIDQKLHQAGFNILASTPSKMGAQGETSLSITCYGGNFYYVGAYYNNAPDLLLTIQLSNEKGTIHASDTFEVELDLRYLHGKFPVTLTVKSSNPAITPELLLVRGYQSVTNPSADYSANLEEKSFYTVNGVTAIENERKKITSQIDNYLAAELTKQGYTISARKVIVHDGKNTVWPYTFYRENDYVIFAMGADGNPASFQLIDPASKEEAMFSFSDELVEKEERMIQESAEGVVGVTFRDKNPNLWEWAFRPDYSKQSLGSLSVFVVGYRSSGNTSGQASDNKPGGLTPRGCFLLRSEGLFPPP